MTVSDWVQGGLVPFLREREGGVVLIDVAMGSTVPWGALGLPVVGVDRSGSTDSAGFNTGS